VATIICFLVGEVFSIGREPSEQSAVTSPQCQEVVVIVHQGEEILAQCPQGTWIDIVDNNVICRCGTRREPQWFECEPTPETPHTQRIPSAEPPRFDDKRGIEL